MARVSEWTVSELSAAVEAYLQMLALEQQGEKYNKTAVRQMLLAGPISGRSTTEQRMQNISHILKTMGRPWIQGYAPLPNVGVGAEKKIRAIIEDLTRANAAPMPRLPPKIPERKTDLRVTGYWLFLCNRRIWDGETWLRQGESTLLYKVSSHNRYEVQPGDLGVIRINKKPGTRIRKVRPPAIYAIVEIIDNPRLQADQDDGYYVDPSAATEPCWRVPIRILANLVDAPVLTDELPRADDFHHLKDPLNTSTIPISRHAFATIFNRAGIVGDEISDLRKADTDYGVDQLEQEAANADPIRKRVISTKIERGSKGDWVKELCRYRCQVCDAMNLEAVTFLKRDGTPYVEAHHVQPVADLIAGSLGARNIMVLCANHHRQAHYGNFEIIKHLEYGWQVRVDSLELKIISAAYNETIRHPNPSASVPHD